MNTTEKSILEKLKQATRAQHDALEVTAESDKISQQQISILDYQVLLKANLWAHSSLEELLESGVDICSLLPDWPERKKLRYLEQDLTATGVRPPELLTDRPVAKLPELEGPAQAWGILYVMEGSSLGGAVIARNLAENSQLQEVMPSRFYGCYGAKTGHYWKIFRERITSAFQLGLSKTEAVEAAQQTFAYYQQCFIQAKVPM